MNDSHISSSVKLNAAWIELMLAHSSNHNSSIPIHLITEQIDLDDSNLSNNQRQLHLFDLSISEQSVINVSMKNDEQQLDIGFVSL